MPDYKEMYLIMVRAAEQAQNILTEAQQKCEEMYLDAQDDEDCPPPRKLFWISRQLSHFFFACFCYIREKGGGLREKYSEK